MATTNPRRRETINDEKVVTMFEALDDIHSAASEDKLNMVSNLDKREMVGWLRELVYTAQETISEIEGKRNQTLKTLKAVPVSENESRVAVMPSSELSVTQAADPAPINISLPEKIALERVRQHDRQYVLWAGLGFVIAAGVFLALVPLALAIAPIITISSINTTWLVSVLPLMMAVVVWFGVMAVYQKRYQYFLQQAIAEELTLNASHYDRLYQSIGSYLQQQS